MTLNESQSCDNFNRFRFMTVKSTIGRRYDEFKDTVSENIETV